MTYQERINAKADELTALLTYANGVTGAGDATLGDAVKTLVDGYGQGGGMAGYQYDEDCKVMALQNYIKSIDGHIVPLAITMDRDNDFGQEQMPVNPRLTSVTVPVPVECVHPQEAGYMQMADVIYSHLTAYLN